MKDIDKSEAFKQMKASRQVKHERNQRFAALWWKYWGMRKVVKAAKKGKHDIYLSAPVGTSCEICNILSSKGFFHNTIRKNKRFMEIYINWA